MKRLVLFFTYGISLKIWTETGLIDREILLYKRLIKKNINVSFITYGDESDYQYRDKLGGIEIIPFYAYVKKQGNKGIKFLQSFFLPVILKKHIMHADLLKTNQMSTSWAPILAKLLYGKKLIIRCGFEWYQFLLKGPASLFMRLFIYITEWLSYHIADGIILTSRDDARYITQKFHIENKNKIRIIPNYIDANIFKPEDNIEKKQDHLLFIGRMTAQKNLFNLFDAIKGTRYTLDIIGDGALKEKLLRYALQDHIKVNFSGVYPNNKIPELLNQYGIFILPSYFEGNPKVLIEAMSCGLAVIGTNVKGIKEIIRHNENGLLCNTDADSIGNAIKLLMHDKRLRQRLGANARKTIVSDFSLENIVENECNIYRELLR